MKRMYAILAAGSMFATAAAAQQEDVVFERKVMAPQIRVMSVQGGVMGRTAKGAPYSAVEISETTQMLADGTRIHNESRTQVYRDSEGRLRRETPNEITIWDPVANVSWMLNPKTQTARKLPMGNFVYTTSDRGPNAHGATFDLRYDVKSGPIEAGVVEARVAEVRQVEAKMKAEIEAHVRMNGTPGVMAPAPALEIRRALTAQRMKVNTESLGKRMIEGVNSEGTRHTSTTEAGAIGNDRPIHSITERWYSPELQTVMLTRSTDPRTGEESFRLVNVSRSEPAAYLFQVPAGYEIIDAKYK